MAEIEITQELEPAKGASIAEQRRALPDEPGVYIFRDSEGKVLYVGKATSVRKRV
ncbi:MAG TPA: GIY-YIG nuclease family protein, partial [Solirubrobacterales bacterium]|nr:GIY-YIG nuclease family protein [Solirubrobacterales bacterium]